LSRGYCANPRPYNRAITWQAHDNIDYRDHVVSGEHNLLDLESYRDIRILKARDLLDILESWLF
jgi:hypothetical protein